MFLEIQIPESSFYIISCTKILGYVIISKDNVLIEFHLLPKYIPQCRSIFSFVLKNLKINSIYCKSFDALLLRCCMSEVLNYKIIGHLFRDRIKPAAVEINVLLTKSKASREDYPLLVEYSDNVFENDNEISDYIDKELILIYRNAGEFVGYGIFAGINENRNYYDIGMYVNPAFRKQGYAAYIIKDLAMMCEENNHRPVLGCSANNVASKRAIENAGFVSKHTMLEFYN